MEKRTEVTAAKPHRSGYAKGAVKKGDKYTVPDTVVPGLVRQGLINKPGANEGKS